MAYLDEFRGIWAEILEKFSETLSSSTIDLWFGNVKFVDFKGNTLTISVDSLFVYNRIRTKYLETIQSEFCRHLGFDIVVDLIFDDSEKEDPPYLKRSKEEEDEEEEEKENNGKGNDTDDNSRDASDSSDSSDGSFDEVGGKWGSTLPPYNFQYTFDNFIVGNSNRFAHAACTAVASHPAMNYNPLFIYGPSGLGKTHLLYAITNEMKKKNPRCRIIYINSEDFTNQFINALATNKTAEFRDKYRSCDMLLIDDIQFIAGKVSTQEEFFHTFNALYEDHKQIILTSDRPPMDMKPLEERLKTRFEWGLVADIQPPDLELRIAIIQKKAEQVNITLSEEVLTYIAENLRSNIRKIEGAVKKLAAVYFLSGKEIDLETASRELQQFIEDSVPLDDMIDKVFSFVYKKFNVSREDIVSPKRSHDIAEARHLSIYLIRKITDISLPSIGKIFNRDHTTVLSSINKVEKRIVNNNPYRIKVNEMMKEITGKTNTGY